MKIEKKSATKDLLIRAVPFVSTLVVSKFLTTKRGKAVSGVLDRRAHRVRQRFAASIAGTRSKRRRGFILGGVTALALGAGLLARGLKK